MSVFVLKFGGSSVATIEKIQAVARRVAKISQHYRCAVVVSAMGDDTDILLEQATSLHPQRHWREYDMLLATGEQKSIALLSMALQEQAIAARPLTGWQAKIQTTSHHSHARIVHIDTRVIEECWKRDEIPVIAGFQGVCDQEITTLGRGGSDLSAVALAAALNAEECQIFTDVDGVYSADPRIVPDAVKWEEITYEMMLELASVGAQVLHNRAVELACKMHVKLRVLSSFVEGAGTVVSHAIKKVSTVSGVAMQSRQAVISVRYKNEARYYYDLLTILNHRKVSMGSVHLSSYRPGCALLSCAVPMSQIEELIKEFESLLEMNLEGIEHRPDQTQISIVGVGIQSSERLFSQVHLYFAEKGIRPCLITSSESRYSFYVDDTIAQKVTRDLHSLFHLQAI